MRSASKMSPSAYFAILHYAHAARYSAIHHMLDISYERHAQGAPFHVGHYSENINTLPSKLAFVDRCFAMVFNVVSLTK